MLATYVKALKDAFTENVANDELITLLYSSVAEPLGLLNRNDDPIDCSKTQASYIMNRQKGGNALKVIRAGAADEKVRNSIGTFFRKNIVIRIHEEKKEDLIVYLRRVLEEDRTIADEKRKELLSLSEQEDKSEFLGRLYLYVVAQENVLKNVRLKTQDEIEQYKREPLKKLTVPASLIDEERRYANELLKVYGQLEGKTAFEAGDLNSYPKYKKNFDEQRSYYFLAEAVRRGTRDIYEDEVQFAELKDETYEGVKEIWEDDYPNGMKRLKKVLSAAAQTPVNRCWLSRETSWIGNSQKKGVCHFLVNDGRLKGWVREDDRDSV